VEGRLKPSPLAQATRQASKPRSKRAAAGKAKKKG
jgi:hypothetical protein